MVVLAFDGVRFSYGERAVLAGVSLDVTAGEVFVVLGPSGSGKSTVLRLAAGLDAPGAGTISLHGQRASADSRLLIEPSARRLALVFQDLALWPHMTCDQQLHFVAPALERSEREALLSDVGLSGLEDRYPAHMSGGERQRLALARALAAKPRLLLLDEPFANVDPGLRVELRRLLLELRRAYDVTIVYVTHDLEDAFALADRIAILHRGTIEQTGTPEELYRCPVSTLVATFVGKAAVLPATIEGGELSTFLGNVPNPRPDVDLESAGGIEVVVRPEDVDIADDGLVATVSDVVFAGDRYLVRASTASGPVWTHSPTRCRVGDSIVVRIRRGWPLASVGSVIKT